MVEIVLEFEGWKFVGGEVKGGSGIGFFFFYMKGFVYLFLWDRIFY